MAIYNAKIRREHERDFKRRVKYWRGAVRHESPIRRWRKDTLIQIHPWGDNKADLKRLKMARWQCVNADIYWQHKGHTAYVMFNAKMKEAPAFYARRDDITRGMLYIRVLLKHKVITKKLIHRVLTMLSKRKEIWQDDFINKQISGPYKLPVKRVKRIYHA